MDKEGGFVIATEEEFSRKGLDAVTKNSRVESAVLPKKVKSGVAKFCEDLSLPDLKKSLQACKNDSLSLFFSVKTHKLEWPFRAIASSKGTWQRLLWRHLEKVLSFLPFEDPLLVRDSNDVCAFLNCCEGSSLSAFSVDVKNLFFSLPQAGLLKAVRDRIDEVGVVPFQNKMGFSLGGFLELLRAYL